MQVFSLWWNTNLFAKVCLTFIFRVLAVFLTFWLLTFAKQHFQQFFVYFKQNLVCSLPKQAPIVMADDIDNWIDIAQQCKYLPENILKKLCDIVSEILLEESNVQPVSTPVTVCGDIHGQVACTKAAFAMATYFFFCSFTTSRNCSAKEVKCPTQITFFWAILSTEGIIV